MPLLPRLMPVAACLGLVACGGGGGGGGGLGDFVPETVESYEGFASDNDSESRLAGFSLRTRDDLLRIERVQGRRDNADGALRLDTEPYRFEIDADIPASGIARDGRGGRLEIVDTFFDVDGLGRAFDLTYGTGADDELIGVVGVVTAREDIPSNDLVNFGTEAVVTYADGASIVTLSGGIATVEADFALGSARVTARNFDDVRDAEGNAASAPFDRLDVRGAEVDGPVFEGGTFTFTDDGTVVRPTGEDPREDLAGVFLGPVDDFTRLVPGTEIGAVGVGYSQDSEDLDRYATIRFGGGATRLGRASQTAE